MRFRLLIVSCALAAGVSTADAGYLCDELDAGGRYDLGTACRRDESTAAMEQERREQQREIERRQEEERRRLEDETRQLLLDDRFKALSAPRRDP